MPLTQANGLAALETAIQSATGNTLSAQDLKLLTGLVVGLIAWLTTNAVTSSPSGSGTIS